MTFSEDHTSAPAPFSGDGSIFDHPDVLLQSPTTSERVVDTQSGFLVVIKRMGERLALSCKRRVGTPPSSSVLLTPDESLKLSRILATSVSGLDEPTEESSGRSTMAGGRRRFSLTAASGRSKSSPIATMRKPAVVAAALIVSTILLGVGYLAGTSIAGYKKPAKVDALSMANIEKFSRNFVGEMLDFNPDTYKLSQVQAMASMSPELMERYWTEIHFPMSRRQLKSLPQGTTILIDRIVQDRPAPDTAVADIHAQMVNPEAKQSSAVHIKLTLGLNSVGEIQVLEQKDLTNEAAPATAPTLQ